MAARWIVHAGGGPQTMDLGQFTEWGIRGMYISSPKYIHGCTMQLHTLNIT
jgi:hypothetical protein